MQKIVTLVILIAVVLVGERMVLKQKSIAQTFDKSKYSLSSPSSIWVVVNKQRPIKPRTYRPQDITSPDISLQLERNLEIMALQPEAAKALTQMSAAAEKSGLKFMLASGYRSYAKQNLAYNSEVEAYGQKVADEESARPGFSEHQTGWAADLEPANRKCELEACFAETAEYRWLAENSYKYGFVLRYPKDKQQITGFKFEPWHFRYVGVALAGEMHRAHKTTLEEFFGLPPAPNY
jgi:zinc D-Ala-D-Ala carboxypeptidase